VFPELGASVLLTLCLKHSTGGDFNLVTRDDIEALLRRDAPGWIRR
jgi:hypothetical protein